MFTGFLDNNLFANHAKSYFTRDFIVQRIQFDVIQTILRRDFFYFGLHTLHPWVHDAYLKQFILTPAKCSVTFSIGHRVQLTHVNRMASLAIRSSRRVHFHVGSLAMPIWNKKVHPKLKAKNLLRSPLVILNKVSIRNIRTFFYFSPLQKVLRQGCPQRTEQLKWKVYKPKVFLLPQSCQRTLKKTSFSVVLG